MSDGREILSGAGDLPDSEVVRGGFASPYRLTWRTSTLEGCIYRADGSRVSASERSTAPSGDRLVTTNPEHVDRPRWMKILPGRGVYLGNYMVHYGHFLFETMSTSSIFRQVPAGSFDYFLFHPFHFGMKFGSYRTLALERLGIDPARVVFVRDEPLAVEELLVPPRLARLNGSSDSRLAWVYARIAGAEYPAPAGGRDGRRIYISRRLFAMRTQDRVIANEVQVENLFRDAGFEIVCPEAITYPEQLAICQEARVVAGMSGSNLFNVLFTRPGALLIEIGDPRYDGRPNPCQGPLNAVAGAEGRFIPFRGLTFGPRQTILFDIAYLTRQLEALLAAELPRQRHRRCARRASRSPPAPRRSTAVSGRRSATTPSGSSRMLPPRPRGGPPRREAPGRNSASRTRGADQPSSSPRTATGPPAFARLWKRKAG